MANMAGGLLFIHVIKDLKPKIDLPLNPSLSFAC